jgi:glycosyltransferase involved in cell wall biosynthesis
METKPREILFVSHNASRSGAPLILLGLIRELKNVYSGKLRVLLMEGGELQGDFQYLADTHILYTQPRFILESKKGVAGLFLKLLYKIKARIILSRLKNCRLIFLNTITNGHIHRKLLAPGRRFVTYVHELDSSTRFGTDALALTTTLNHSDYFWTGSRAVRDFLAERNQVPPDKMEVVYSSLGITNPNRHYYADFVQSLKEQFQIPADAFIVGIVGNAEWRKGFDFLFPLAKIYLERYPDGKAFFLWKGYNTGSKSNYFDTFDLKKTGLDKRIILLPHDASNLATIAAFDVHLLLSREDPFPLVVLEAASMEIPTICFKDAGGSPEFVSEGAGICVDYGNLIQVAEAIYELENNNTKRIELGAMAKSRLAQGYSSKDAALRLLELIGKM